MDALNNKWTVRKMHFDTVILAGGIFSTMLLANFFGIEGENIVLYMLVGLVMSGYKLLKAKKYTSQGIIATILLGFFLSVVIAPSIELKLQLHPLTTGAVLGGLVLLGELSIFLVIERIFGIKLEKTEDN